MASMLNKLNGSNLNDSAAIIAEGGQGKNDEVEVVVRKVVEKPAGSSVSDEIMIETEEGKGPAVGNKVTLNGKAVEDGVYSFEDESGEEISCFVKDGAIAGIGDEAIEDLTKTVVSGGKVIKKKIKTIKKRLTAAQKQSLVKARKKANTGSAKKARLKSFKKGQAMGLHNSADPSTAKLDISTIDLNELGDSLYNAVFAALADRYELDDKTIDKLEDMLSEEICKPVVDGNTLKFVVPVWTEIDDKVDLDNFDLAELTYDLNGKFDSEALLKVLTDGDIQMQTSLIV